MTKKKKISPSPARKIPKGMLGLLRVVDEVLGGEVLHSFKSCRAGTVGANRVDRLAAFIASELAEICEDDTRRGGFKLARDRRFFAAINSMEMAKLVLEDVLRALKANFRL